MTARGHAPRPARVAAAERPSLQAELLSGLALVMVLATSLLAGVLLLHGESRLRHLLGRSLLVEARAPSPVLDPTVPDTTWWRVGGDGAAAVRSGPAAALDARSRALAQESRERGAVLLDLGAPWSEIRFAAPRDARGQVVVARLPREASLRLRGVPWAVALTVLVADAAIFTAFGATLLRRRVVSPLERLAEAARAIAEGEAQVRAPVEGSRETAQVALSFNAMTDALAARSGALEKAVAELREANRSLRQAEAGLARAERLAAVGRLAAGVAHEVGNPMGALLAWLDLVGRDGGLSEAGRAHLERAARQGERVRRILRQLLDFSRPPRMTPAAVDLAALAEETAGVVTAQRRYAGIRITLEREGEPPSAWADAGATAQILLNLLLNAADAVAGAEAPQVTLSVRAAALALRPGEDAEAARGREAPDAVECVVADNGPGIAKEDRERIFDPFFSTKPPGEGTGLGLAGALRLAEEQGGRLELAPGARDSGARFVLRLPALRAGAASGFAVRSALRSAEPAAGPEAAGDLQENR